MRWLISSVALIAAAAFPLVVRADLRGSAPAGGGLGPLDVSVDLAAGVVHANDLSVPIALDKSALPPESAVTVESIAIGQGKHVVHVRVPVRGPTAQEGAWEALLVAGHSQPIFAGVTGLAAGDPGERTGKVVQIVKDGDAQYVLVGDVREDLKICGQASTLLDPMALYPASLQLRPATVQRIDAERRAAAEDIEATVKTGPLDEPLSRLLVARGSSVPGSRGGELVDGDVHTAWYERRPGKGQGEFVVMAAPREVPIARMEVVLSSPAEGAVPRTADVSSASPKTFYVQTSTRTIRVTVPVDASKQPGAVFELAFAEPIESSCVALVLDDAYTRGLAHPDVGVAELVAYGPFEGPGVTLGDLAEKLSTQDGPAAAQMLERAGDRALAAVATAYDTLDARGRALAVDVAASAERCESAAPLLVRAACETSGEAPRKAREKLERCDGAAPALAERLRNDAGSRTCLAPLMAAMFPEQALDPIADAMAATDENDHDTRSALRSALADALEDERALAGPRPPSGDASDALRRLLRDPARSAGARWEIVRAAGRRASEDAADVDALAGELLAGAPSMRTRYLLLDPLGVLARGGDAAAARRIGDALARDADWPVRAHAAEKAAGVPSLDRALLAASADPEPRVRQAALAALAASPTREAAVAATDRLARDGWWFVKTEAVKVLSGAPPGRDADDPLGKALGEESARVRGAAVLALAHRHASAWRDAVRDRLVDKDEDHDVRAEAAAALGGMCDEGSIDALVKFANALASRDLDADARQIGLGALVGLSALQPAGLQARLAPILSPNAPSFARAAAKRALAGRAACR